MTAPPQHMTALGRAQEIRLARLAERRRVHALPPGEGMRAVAGLVAEPPEHMRSATVYAVMGWPRRAYDSTVRALLRRAMVSERATLGGITYRQRAALVELIDERYGDAA